MKKPSKQVEEDLSKVYNRTDDKLPDNLIFDQIMMGYYAELKDPKNADKTMQQLKDIVLKINIVYFCMTQNKFFTVYISNYKK